MQLARQEQQSTLQRYTLGQWSCMHWFALASAAVACKGAQLLLVVFLAVSKQPICSMSGQAFKSRALLACELCRSDQGAYRWTASQHCAGPGGHVQTVYQGGQHSAALQCHQL